MFNIIFSDEYKVVPGYIAELRQRAGLSQRDVAAALNRSQSHIYKLETGQRPVEIVEFCRLVRALGAEPQAAFAELLRQWSLQDGLAEALHP
jgi:transcriptional regulator with XRE-family HTH domain